MIIIHLHVDVFTAPQLLLLTIIDEYVRVAFVPIPMGALFLSYLVLSSCMRAMPYKLQSYRLNY